MFHKFEHHKKFDAGNTGVSMASNLCDEDLDVHPHNWLRQPWWISTDPTYVCELRPLKRRNPAIRNSDAAVDRSRSQRPYDGSTTGRGK